MKKEDIFVFGLGWLAANTPQLVQLLNALLPLIVIGVLGYAIHLIGRDRGDKRMIQNLYWHRMDLKLPWGRCASCDGPRDGELSPASSTVALMLYQHLALHS